MKQRISFLLVALMMLTLCMTAQAESSITDEPVTLTVWVGPAWKGVYDPTEPNAENGDFHRKVAADYMALHPNVTINVEVVASAEREEKLSVALQSNTQPDILFEASFLTFDYAHAGLLLPINDIITDADKADISDSIWEEVTGPDGNIYLFPFAAETGHIGINVSLFEEAGLTEHLPTEQVDGIYVWTPDEFRATLEAIKGYKDVYPFALYAGKTAGDTWTNLLLRMYGAKFFNETTTEVIANSEEGVRALEFLKSLQDDGLTAPGVETLTVEDTMQMFLNKKLAINVFNNMNYGNLRKGLADGSIEEPFDVAFAYIPSENGPQCFSYIKGTQLFNTGDETRIAVAKDFARFYSSPEAAEEAYVDASMAMTPVRKSVSEKLREVDPIMADVADSLEYSVPFSQKAPGYLQLRAVFISELQAVFTGQKTPADALNDYVTAANETLAKNAERSTLLK